MFEVTVSGWFAAAHQLRLPDGSFEPLHGHNWKVAITFAGNQLDALGVLLDFVELRQRLAAATAALHDRNLNELPPFQHCNPSAENVAVYFAEVFRAPAAGARLRVVEVEEAPGCVARFLPAT